MSEVYNTGEKDSWGHFVYKLREVENDDGDVIKQVEFVIPPSITELCLYLGISRETWRRYVGSDEEFAAVGEWVRSKIRGYLERELMTRKKGLQGVIFNLQNNYSEGETIIAGSTAAEANMTTDEKLKLIKQVAERIRGLSDDAGQDC